MSVSCSHTEDRDVIEKNIQDFGCHLVLIEPDNYLPGFVYSIGLFERFNHPEIICFGLNINVTASIINDACAQIKEGTIFTTNEKYAHFLQNYDIQFLDVNASFYPNYLGYGGWYYGTFDFPALQLVWPDKQHKFPWHEGFNSDWKFKQPLLDRDSDFKFYEERNVAVFTTEQAFDGDAILYVYHNEDGDWQFHTSLNPNLDDSKVVSLEQITQIDPSINEIYYLQYGWHAWRENKAAKWQYGEDTD
ncbi:DUF4262 domain-containing protein [Mucilaginibacter sp. HD30]